MTDVGQVEERRSNAELLRLIAKDHERLAPNACHSAETLRQIADTLATQSTTLAAMQAKLDAANGLLRTVKAHREGTPDPEHEHQLDQMIDTHLKDTTP